MKIAMTILLTIYFQISACSFTKTISSSIEPTTASAVPQVTSHDVIAQDFVNALIQLERFQPESTTVAASTSERQDSFTISVLAALQKAGYSTTWSSQDAAETLFQYRIYQEQPAPGVYRELYELTVGSVEMRRAYGRYSQQRVRPLTPLFVRGADASALELNDTIFDQAETGEKANPNTATNIDTSNTDAVESTDPLTISPHTPTIDTHAEDNDAVSSSPTEIGTDSTLRTQRMSNRAGAYRQNGKKAIPLDTSGSIQSQDQRKFTIQLIASRDLTSVQDFLRRNAIVTPYSILSFERGENVWFALVHGVFNSRREALRAIEKLPPAVRRELPWVRSIAMLQEHTWVPLPDNTGPSHTLSDEPAPAPASPTDRIDIDRAAHYSQNLPADHIIVEEQVLTFPSEFMHLGRHNKALVLQLVNAFDPETDVFSVYGCSAKPAASEKQSSDQALARTNRIVEALRFAGVNNDLILNDSCSTSNTSVKPLPRRAVALTLSRRV